jgi:plastocyanin
MQQGWKRSLARIPVKSLVGAIAVMALVLAPGAVLAFSSFGADFETQHPGSTSFAFADCELCHSADSHSEWNAYGQALRDEYSSNGQDMGAAIATVDSLDSDGDPTASTDGAEAEANTQPGWVYGPFNTIYDSNGAVISSTALPPGSITALLDPVTLVTIGDSAFSPTPVTVKLGKVVQWKPSGTGSHNVFEVGGIFSSGAASTATYYNRTVSAGTFTYIDQAHPTMKGVIKVKPKISAAPTGATFTVTWASTKTNTGTKFTVQYKVGTGAWTNWLRNTSLKKAVFGANGTPIKPALGKKYTFRVQSGTGTVWSGYSPTSAYTP